MRKIGGGRQIENTKTAGKDNSTFYHSRGKITLHFTTVLKIGLTEH